MAYSAMMLDQMIAKATRKMKNAESDAERAEAINELDQLIALRKDLTEASGDSFYKMATLAVTALGVVAPLVVNTRLVKECIKFEDTGAWSHPTIRGLVSKIKIGK